ncbi:MAG: hypothetical protein KF788_09445 [Piscinibacter sp.]|nr:hypothetical protein [Piscinibacter sp.]
MKPLRWHAAPGAALVAVTLALVTACGKPAETVAPAPPPAASAGASAAAQVENRLVALLQGAEIQAETDAQRAELRRALQDLRDKPPAELAAARYAGADGQPGQRSLEEILRAHLVPDRPVAIDLDALVAGRAESGGRRALDDTLARIGATAR